MLLKLEDHQYQVGVLVLLLDLEGYHQDLEDNQYLVGVLFLLLDLECCHQELEDHQYLFWRGQD